MYLCARVIDFESAYNFLLDFLTVSTVSNFFIPFYANNKFMKINFFQVFKRNVFSYILKGS